MNIQNYALKVIKELREIVQRIDTQCVEDVAKSIIGSNRVFVTGAGRSLLMLRAFAMRLMHLGLVVHVVGETTTPSITSEDLLLIGSGSGATATLGVMAEKAKKVGANVIAMSIYRESPISQLADHVLVIPAATNKIDDGNKSWQPAGNSFEQSLLIILDSMAIRIAEILDIDTKPAFKLHANLE